MSGVAFSIQQTLAGCIVGTSRKPLRRRAYARAFTPAHLRTPAPRIASSRLPRAVSAGLTIPRRPSSRTAEGWR
jgi:hypothetical protein